MNIIYQITNFIGKSIDLFKKSPKLTTVLLVTAVALLFLFSTEIPQLMEGNHSTLSNAQGIA